MEQAYAVAVWRAVQSGKNPKEAVEALRTTLAHRGRTALFPAIARAFRRFAERERAKNMLTLSLASVRDERSKKEAMRALQALGVQKESVEIRADDSQIGGWRLEGQGYLLDASFKKYLLEMYKRVVENKG